MVASCLDLKTKGSDGSTGKRGNGRGSSGAESCLDLKTKDSDSSTRPHALFGPLHSGPTLRLKIDVIARSGKIDVTVCNVHCSVTAACPFLTAKCSGVHPCLSW